MQIDCCYYRYGEDSKSYHSSKCGDEKMERIQQREMKIDKEKKGSNVCEGTDHHYYWCVDLIIALHM